ncbi:MAG: hypothetical protein K0R68_2825 [Mycobacterium sp.]|jgi:hypothetical protein|nr:hypothetical protein [Mycobacterium sp.]
MSTFTRSLVAAAAVGTMLATAAPAAAWPIALTAEDIRYLDATRGAFPGNDDQLLLVGKQMCRQLYTGTPAQVVIDTTAAQYGTSPAQASVVLGAARSTMCTQAPG